MRLWQREPIEALKESGARTEIFDEQPVNEVMTFLGLSKRQISDKCSGAYRT